MTSADLLASVIAPPITDFVVKIASRCNLSCSYCYLYAGPDQGWRRQPVSMSAATVAQFAAAVRAHVLRHALPSVSVTLHGGEPLLVGPAYLRWFLETVRAAVPRETELRVRVQTNGVLLDDEILAVFHEHDVRVGVSLDGPAAAHDDHRRFAGGRGSHAAVDRALRLLSEPRHRRLFGGILAVVDLAHPAEEVYVSVAGYGPPAADFLLPHANWGAPPARPPEGAAHYGAWLATAFDLWFAAPEPSMRVRLFEDAVSLCIGGEASGDQLGQASPDHLVVETDGSLELTDTLKSAHDGASVTGLHIGSADLARWPAADPPRSATCLACPRLKTCGGGHVAHRYDPGNGFANPSVFCDDLAFFLDHVAARIARAG